MAVAGNIVGNGASGVGIGHDIHPRVSLRSTQGYRALQP